MTSWKSGEGAPERHQVPCSMALGPRAPQRVVVEPLTPGTATSSFCFLKRGSSDINGSFSVSILCHL